MGNAGLVTGLGAILCGTIVASSFAAPAEGQERIRVSPESPWYWWYGGKTVLLLGASDEDNLFNNPELMMDNLDKLQKCGGNYIRATLSCRDEGNVWPYLMVGGRYDLDKFNPEFWNRLKRCCEECLKRGIILQIEFWATFDYYRDNWLKNPFNPKNNVNYTTQNTKLQKTWDFHPAHKPQPFFFSVPEKNNDRLVLKYQEAFVRKVLDVTLPYPNVLYCLDNETRAPAEWALYWGRFINDEAKRRGTTIQLTEMWDIWDIRHEDHSTTYKHPEFFSFTDVSQNNWQVGQLHYDRLIWFRENLKRQPGGPRPMNNVKVYKRVGSKKPGSAEINMDRWWQNIWAGCASTRFHRPDGGIGLSPEAQDCIRAARAFTDAFDFFRCEPRPDLLGEREANEAYCLARPPEVFALYFPKGGEVTVKVGDGTKQLTVRWMNVRSARFSTPQTLPQQPVLRLKTPDTKQTWLALITAPGAR